MFFACLAQREFFVALSPPPRFRCLPWPVHALGRFASVFIPVPACTQLNFPAIAGMIRCGSCVLTTNYCKTPDHSRNFPQLHYATRDTLPAVAPR